MAKLRNAYESSNNGMRLCAALMLPPAPLLLIRRRHFSFHTPLPPPAR